MKPIKCYAVVAEGSKNNDSVYLWMTDKDGYYLVYCGKRLADKRADDINEKESAACFKSRKIMIIDYDEELYNKLNS